MNWKKLLRVVIGGFLGGGIFAAIKIRAVSLPFLGIILAMVAAVVVGAFYLIKMMVQRRQQRWEVQKPKLLHLWNQLTLLKEAVDELYCLVFEEARVCNMDDIPSEYLLGVYREIERVADDVCQAYRLTNRAIAEIEKGWQMPSPPDLSREFDKFYYDFEEAVRRFNQGEVVSYEYIKIHRNLVSEFQEKLRNAYAEMSRG